MKVLHTFVGLQWLIAGCTQSSRNAMLNHVKVGYASFPDLPTFAARQAMPFTT
jgi:hypothetical protein